MPLRKERVCHSHTLSPFILIGLLLGLIPFSRTFYWDTTCSKTLFYFHFDYLYLRCNIILFHNRYVLLFI